VLDSNKKVDSLINIMELLSNNNLKILFCFILLFSSIYAIDDIFTKEFYSKGTEMIYSTTRIVEQNPYCLMGLMGYCNLEEVKVVQYIRNQKLYLPFPKEALEIKRGIGQYSLYSYEDYVLMNYLSDADLKSSKDMNSIEEIYLKTIEVSYKEHLNCKESASLFKILYLNSQLINHKQNYTLLKIYTYDNVYTAHRFNALKNENGYYILDPLSCTVGSFEYCVYSHTRRFYDDPSSILYRGKVYRVEEYIR